MKAKAPEPIQQKDLFRMEYFQHKAPMRPMSFVKWRKRLGKQGCEKLLEAIIQVGLRTKAIEEKDFKTEIFYIFRSYLLEFTF